MLYATITVAVLGGILYLALQPASERLIIKGNVYPKFKRVEELFESASQGERGGTAMAVLYKGELVADLWGGWADKDANVLWEKSTLASAYSLTKIFVGLTMAKLNLEDTYDYDNKVTDFWPEFGSHGKENTTILQILDHQAGLIRFSRDFSLQEAKDSTVISRIIEETVPQWKHGEKMGYAGLSYGFLVDQLVRRLDKKHRSAVDYVKEELLAKAQGLDFFIGAPVEQQYRMARVSNPSLLQSTISTLSDPIRYLNIMHNFFKHDMIAEASGSYPRFLDIMPPSPIPYNGPVLRSFGLLSCSSVGTARGLAAAVRIAASQIPRDHLLSIMNKVQEAADIVLTTRRHFGHGFSFARHPLEKEQSNPNFSRTNSLFPRKNLRTLPKRIMAWETQRFIIQFIGNGQQMVAFDPIDDLIVVILRNGLHAAEDGRPEMEAILLEAFRSAAAA